VDTRLSHSRPRFELGRGVVDECGVTTQSIIEHFNVLKDVLYRLVPCTVPAMIDEFALQCAEEAFDTGIVPIVSLSRHAAGRAVRGEQLLIRRGGILAAPIRVVQQPRLGGAIVDRHRQRLLREIHGEPGAYRPADHGARVEVEDHRQREPALCGPDVGEVPGPHPVRILDRELAIEGILCHG